MPVLAFQITSYQDVSQTGSKRFDGMKGAVFSEMTDRYWAPTKDAFKNTE